MKKEVKMWGVEVNGALAWEHWSEGGFHPVFDLRSDAKEYAERKFSNYTLVPVLLPAPAKARKRRLRRH